MALSTLSSIVTPEISRDIITDLLSLLASSRAYLRKKAVLCLYRIFLKDPPALRTCFPKLKERLSDEDQGVLTGTVNTFLELARKNAKNYLSLVPQLFHILVNTTNNWLSIKLLKVFQLLCPLEPRLPAKMVEPITNILNTTKAQSVEFEAIRMVVRSMPEGTSIFALSMEKLQSFLNSSDRNLRYLALELFKEVLDKAQSKDKLAVPDLHEKVLTSIEESDITARRIALLLLDRIVSPSNFQDAVQRLLDFSKKATPNDEYLGTILRIGARDRYALVEDFAWYLLILGEIGRNVESAHANAVAEQFVDICVRVPQVRPYAVTLALGLLAGDPSTGAGTEGNATITGISMAMIGACAWVLGEYHGDVEKPAEASFLSAAKILLSAKAMQPLEPSIQTQCIWAAIKLYLSSPQQAPGAVVELHTLLNSSLPSFVRSTHVDVSERAALCLHMASFYKVDPQRVVAGLALFEEALKPVKSDAQAQVPVPDGLDLDEPFFPPEESPQQSFAAVRADPADPYALAATYKDDLGFMASQAAAHTATTVASGTQASSMFYLGGSSKEQAQARGGVGGDAKAGESQAAPAEAKDTITLMRERLEAQRAAAGSAGPRYQVMREEATVPGATTSPGGGQTSTSSSSQSLPIPPEKELADLHGRLWSLCSRGDHVAVYACVRSPNLKKQLLRIDFRCERLNPGDSAVVSDVALRLPAGLSAQEADASGLLMLAPGELQQRSQKVKANVGTAPFVSPGVCALECDLQYKLTPKEGDAQSAASQNMKIDLRLPATTFLVPRSMAMDDVAEYMQEHAQGLLSHQTAQALSLTSPGRAVDVVDLIGRCAGLCRFHGIRQSDVDQTKGQKFILTGAPPANTGAPLFNGQTPLPHNAVIVCMCLGKVEGTDIQLQVRVKSCQKEISDEICSHLASTFRELVEGRLRPE
eukprot:TRINITY_DN22567_c0_g1_i1.p1 TRINITY_DN22567_c0_g1~~TRINITY_DN22567_c0_g1_i1.p1  ORF type:complete len:1069 (-),score=197.76 TRINITY_DN22567_c0_g1_i1:78-2870(-)